MSYILTHPPSYSFHKYSLDAYELTKTVSDKKPEVFFSTLGAMEFVTEYHNSVPNTLNMR